MKNYRQVNREIHFKNKNCVEHSPIYDLAEYEQRQQKLKSAKLRRNIIHTLTFCLSVLCITPLLFMVG